MSNQNTALPVRTEGDLQEKIQSKIVDFTDPTKGAQVDSDKNLHVEIHGNTPSDTDKPVRLNEDGLIAINGEYNVTTNSIPSSVGLIGHLRDAAKSLVHQLKRISAIDSSVDSGVTALDVAVRDENGNPFSASNPLPVTNVDSEGSEVNDFYNNPTVASGDTVYHQYTVTALKKLKLSQVFGSASGKMKLEVQVETGLATGIYDTKFVGFNSTATPNIEFNIKENIEVAAGVKVRTAVTNRDNQPLDLYSTICGHEI